MDRNLEVAIVRNTKDCAVIVEKTKSLDFTLQDAPVGRCPFPRHTHSYGFVVRAREDLILRWDYADNGDGLFLDSGRSGVTDLPNDGECGDAWVLLVDCNQAIVTEKAVLYAVTSPWTSKKNGDYHFDAVSGITRFRKREPLNSIIRVPKKQVPYTLTIEEGTPLVQYTPIGYSDIEFRFEEVPDVTQYLNEYLNQDVGA